jgi:antitoxin component YwqK of YwqJK toxin-antitoxin module
MKYIYSAPFLILFILNSCASSGTEQTNEIIKDSVTTEQVDSVQIESIEVISEVKKDNFTVQIMIDGPDNDLYIDDEFPENYLEFPEIDIIPYSHSSENDESFLDENLMVIAANGFRFYGELSEYTGIINMYLDNKKDFLLTSYKMIKGNPDGICTLYDPIDDIYLERIYENGKWVGSNIEPYAIDWTFDQATSDLQIEDLAGHIFSEKGKSIIQLMTPFHKKPGDNTLDKILEKASFKQAFQVNGEIFTGKLEGYFHPIDFTDEIYFELNFLDGKLHGDIKVWSEWYGLELHETFGNGELIEQVYVMDESDMDGVAKPIIYLYPEKETKINVQLDFNGSLTHTYPKYPQNGWAITAHEDGTLFDENNKEYYALYWEGMESSPLDIPNGNIIKGSETVAFLEAELPKLGLSSKEANEFIIYWLPQLENNPYNLIHFSTQAYEDLAHLKISPSPETLIRVMMVFQPLNFKKDYPKQNLTPLKKERKGFTVVEWGGRKLKQIRI